MNYKEILEQLRQYNGKNLQEIGEYLEDDSHSTYSYFKLPNGMIIMESFDYFSNSGQLYIGDYCVGGTDEFNYIKIED